MTDTTYYIYVKEDGYPDIQTYELDKRAFPGYTLVGTTQVRPNLAGKKMVNGQWVWGGSEPEYKDTRRREYPSIGEQLDELWHAMDTGVLPKVAGFYDPLKAVKDKHKKP